MPIDSKEPILFLTISNYGGILVVVRYNIMELDVTTEERLKKRALEILEHGRPGWDGPHTLAAVYWLKELLKAEGGDAHVLVPAMYLHDIGWARSDFENSWASIKNAKDEHMEKGVVMARPILEELGFSEGEMAQIGRLIGMHDKLEQILTMNEQLIFEADGLGQIDVERVKSTFKTREDRQKFMSGFENRRVPRFKTVSGKLFLDKILPKALEFYDTGVTLN